MVVGLLGNFIAQGATPKNTILGVSSSPAVTERRRMEALLCYQVYLNIVITQAAVDSSKEVDIIVQKLLSKSTVVSIKTG